MDQIYTAPVGSLVTLEERLPMSINPVDFFSKLSNYGRTEHALLFESAELIQPYGEQSIGFIDPCLKITGHGNAFSVKALNTVGVEFLTALHDDLSFCTNLSVKPEEIRGTLVPDRKVVSESERLHLRTHMDVLRAIAFKYKPMNARAGPYGGLFGSFSYDFIDQFEDLPRQQQDLTGDPDYEMYYADTLFQYDHRKQVLSFLSNALLLNTDRETTLKRCQDRMAPYRAALTRPVPLPRTFNSKKMMIETDMPEPEFCSKVKQLQEHINRGDIFQAVLSRSIIADYTGEPLDIYQSLRRVNPSPYMFFINFGQRILFGASPERCISVTMERETARRFEIHPIAGTKPRGWVGNHMDVDLDNRFETELRLDPKELAEHTMLVDLARNDVARVSKPGTRRVEDPYRVVHYSHVHHLVSKVSGILRDEYDALHAYLASMNMGTLTGAPKVEAMRLLRHYESSKRGFYGGSVFYLTPSGNMDSAITIRSMNLKNEKAYLRAGAGIVYDSVPKNEFDETERKLAPCLKALRLAGGYT